ncbi:MAG: hypothetical protein ACXWEA_04935, partial [Solirubrobacterales bacterium]
MLIATYASAALVCAASVLVGRAILCALGRDAWSGIEPALGLGALIAVCSVTIRLPHRGTTTLLALILILLAAVVHLRGRAIPSPGLGLATVIGLLTLLLASIPFIVSGHISVLGIGVNNDLAGHLDYTAWLTDPIGQAPPTIRHGYPLGPHGLAAAISEGTGSEPLAAILGLLLAIPVLTALTAAAVLRELRAPLRVIAAVLTGLTYLAASTLAVGGFKETIMALIVLGFVLGLRELTRGEGDRRGLLIALGVLMAGMLGVYSYPGLVYAGAIGVLWAVIELASAWRRGESEQAWEAIRRAAPLALIPLAVLLVIGLASLPRILDFAQSGTIGFVQDAASRLHEKTTAFEALGAWPSGDFLLGTKGLSSYLVFGLIGAAALAVGVVAAGRRHERALLAGLVGAALIYVLALINGGFYVQAKALAIVAPLAALIALRGLLGPSGRVEGPPDAPPKGDSQSPLTFSSLGRVPAALKTTLAVAFVAIAAYSSFLALRDARVAPAAYAQEQLGEFRPIVHGKRVLSLTSDRFTDYY